MARLSPSAAAAAILACCIACSGGPPSDPFPEPIVVEIERGAGSRRIGEQLVEAGVTNSMWLFLWERAWNLDAKLMAGEYIFERPVSASEAFEILAAGKVRLYPLTIPEGLNRFQIADVIDAAGLATRDEALALTADPGPVKDLLPQAESLEGVLYPETYSLAKSSTAEDLLDAMVDRFLEALAEAREQRTVEIGDWEAVILASMIEEEAVGQTERGLVSSVFHNRIRRGMLMQCDPTIIYGLVREDRYRGKIYLSDLRDPHPYNTYIHEGLPPGPIASPGLESLKAAFAPSESDFLFFVAAPGVHQGHVFSAKLQDHNRAVRELRQYQRSRR